MTAAQLTWKVPVWVPITFPDFCLFASLGALILLTDLKLFRVWNSSLWRAVYSSMFAVRIGLYRCKSKKRIVMWRNDTSRQARKLKIRGNMEIT
jgi:hypothetical protein